MTSRVLNFSKLALLAVAALLVFSSTATTQTERSRPGTLPDESIQVGTASARSPAVNLRTVGKEVSPGVFEVDPSALRGKRLAVPKDEQAQARFICIGKWKNGECKGIYIEF